MRELRRVEVQTRLEPPNYPAALCFSEFMVFDLEDGEITVHTGPDGTCGAYMDPSIKPPLAAFPLATAVVAGGGDGVIAGGTGKYRKWTGTFTDRVFVGFGGARDGIRSLEVAPVPPTFVLSWFAVESREVSLVPIAERSIDIH